jgi:general secretion pathway protein D
LSAKRTQTVVLVALTQIVLAAATPTLLAVSPGGTSASSAAPAPASQQDADLMLREARGAIEQGRLDEAEKILTRVEGAHVKYSMFHVGPTPASVRRELTRAQRQQGSAGKSSGQANSAGVRSYLPFARGGNAKTNGTQDPFGARSAANSAANTPTEPGRSLGAVAAPPAMFPAENSSRGSKAPYPVTTASAESDANPFRAADLALPTAAPSGLGPASPARENQPAQPKQLAQAKLAAARRALDAGDIGLAEKLTQAAISSGVPESDYLPDEDRPSLVAWDVAQAKQRAAAASTASNTVERLPAATPAGGDSPSRYELPTRYESIPRYDTPSRYDVQPPADANPASSPATAPSDAAPPVVSAQAQSDAPLTARSADDGPRMVAPSPFNAPLNTLNSPLRIAQNPEPAAATPTPENLPQPLANTGSPMPDGAEQPSSATASTAKASLIDRADENQQALAHQLSAEIGRRQSEAQRILEKDPERALATLHEAQQLVRDSKLPESIQRELLGRIDITLKKTESYTKQHGGQIELDKQNAAVMAERKRDQEMRFKMQQTIAENIDEFNRLKDEQRYAEAEIIARRLNEIAPDDPVVAQVWQMAKFLRREMMNDKLADNKEQSVWNQLNAVEESSINPVGVDGQELVIDQKYWNQFVKDRKGSKDRIQRRTERELEIEKRLKTPVLLKYQDTPLSEVMDGLSELTGVNIHLDPRGLTQEGVNTDTPVTIHLTKEVQLKSALNLILEPLHLSYVVHDEVLKITSEQLRDGEIYPIPYNVADLVTPIPNFVPSNNIGLQGLINEATANAGRGNRPAFAQGGPTVLVNDRSGQQAAGGGDNILAQQFNAAGPNGLSPSTVPIGAGPGGMGGAANADFDSLIDLIVSTVQTETWAENGGGEAEIRPFPTNLSLVISQTQAVHEEIADLLQQLRRLQDLQVTIEVRFIRLNDRFFERIGIDFDLDINDNGVTAANSGDFQPINPEGRSNTVGLQRAAPPIAPFPNFTTDLDIPFRQGSFDVALPPFGGFDPNSAATFGFAILSDLEAFFLIEAAQGDARTNVLNAPKVTLFNGQQAFVADATQRPFVVGVIPVVGEFAAAQQPVIVVLNEGTMMTIQAVVSEDRRYVRMTIVPFFTQIGDVDEFTFEGSSSTTSTSASKDDDDDGKNESKENSDAETRSGVTVQLPSFSFVSVVTTVSVPDGGTVLLGGIKRLSEGRNEFGVPLLSKIPYINRLFRNVAIGRETDSLMMMVTPRIIIQEEEEERLGIAVP